MRSKIIIVIALFYSWKMVAQNDAANIIKSVNEAYSNQKNMLITTTYKMYSTHSTNTVYETMQGTVKKQGYKIAYRLKDIERLENASRRILVNHEDKTVFVEPNKGNRQTYVMDTELENFLKENNVGQVTDKGSYWLLVIEMETNDLDRIQIEVDKTTKFIIKLTNFYRQEVRLDQNNPQAPLGKPRLEITFQVNTNPVFTTGEFSESKFIKLTNGKASLNDSLKNKYQIMSID
jgi:hypothetical protein